MTQLRVTNWARRFLDDYLTLAECNKKDARYKNGFIVCEENIEKTLLAERGEDTTTIAQLKRCYTQLKNKIELLIN